jgi:hypothetical protein
MYAALQEFASSEHFLGKADQFLLNDFMYRAHGEVKIVHSVFNLPISVKFSNPSLYQDLRKQARMLHFTNLKPWNLGLPKRIRRTEIRDWLSVAKALSEYRLWWREERRNSNA